jgi:hypothetical protein
MNTQTDLPPDTAPFPTSTGEAEHRRGRAMTQEEKRIAIAKVCGVHNQFVLVKRGLYYRPEGQGYTSNINEAWRLPEEQATRHEYPHDRPVTKKPAPLPDYFGDLNAMHEAEKVLDVSPESPGSIRYSYAYFVYILTPREMQPMRAPAAVRAEAFGLAMDLWEKE